MEVGRRLRRPFILDTFFVIFVEEQQKSNTQLSPVTNGKCCETTCWDVKRLQAFTLNSCNRNVMAAVMGGGTRPGARGVVMLGDRMQGELQDHLV